MGQNRSIRPPRPPPDQRPPPRPRPTPRLHPPEIRPLPLHLPPPCPHPPPPPHDGKTSRSRRLRLFTFDAPPGPLASPGARRQPVAVIRRGFRVQGSGFRRSRGNRKGDGSLFRVNRLFVCHGHSGRVFRTGHG